LLQFKEGGGKFPQVYAFALVEQRQHNLLRLRMFLAGEVMNLNTDVIESRTRLLKMHGLITSPGLLHEKRLFSVKVTFFHNQIGGIYYFLCNHSFKKNMCIKSK
jgi:senataxin